MALKTILKYFFDLIYPPRCPLCGEFVSNEKIACASCSASIQPLEADAVFPHLDHLYIDRCISCCAYEGQVRCALHGYKYQERLDQVGFFGDMLAKRLAEICGFDLVVPVPMYGRKLKVRGFNQSALLARHVGKVLNVECDLHSLKRIRDDDAQVGLERADRLKNIKGAFGVSPSSAHLFKDKSVLIVDDVLTTGATVNECAHVLKSAGAKNVTVITIARALA